MACAAKVAELFRAVTAVRARCVAFVMGQRERLGAGSLVRALDPEVVQMILQACAVTLPTMAVDQSSEEEEDSEEDEESEEDDEDSEEEESEEGDDDDP